MSFKTLLQLLLMKAPTLIAVWGLRFRAWCFHRVLQGFTGLWGSGTSSRSPLYRASYGAGLGFGGHLEGKNPCSAGPGRDLCPLLGSRIERAKLQAADLADLL